MGRNLNNGNLIGKIYYKLEDYISFLFVEFMFILSKILPMFVLTNICGILLVIFGVFIKHSRIAMNNFKIAFPDISFFKRFKLLIENLFLLGKFGGEFFYVHSIKKDKLLKLVSSDDKESYELIKKVSKSKTGSLIFSGHFANWELALRYLSENGMKLNVIYRKLNNELLENKITKTRESCGVKMIAKGPVSIMKIFKALKNGENVIILTDQRYDNGIKSKLLGHDSYTTDSLAIIAKKFRCPIYSIVTIRDGFSSKMKVHMREFEYFGNDSDELITQNMNNVIGEWIKNNPNQWLFLHNRWKNE